MNTRATHLLLALAALAVAPAHANVLTINVNAEITAMTLTGTAPVPLAQDPGNALGDSVDGYGFVDSLVTLTTSTTRLSTATLSVGIEQLTATSFRVTQSSSFELFLDAAFEDVDGRAGRAYAPGLGSSFTLLSDDPAEAIIAGVISIQEFEVDAVTGAVTVTDFPVPQPLGQDAVFDLGVDVNGNGIGDKIRFGAADVVLDPLGDVAPDVLFGDITASLPGIDPTQLLDAALLFASGQDATLDIVTALSISSGSLLLQGLVADTTTDPPFSIAMQVPIPTASAPAPGPAALLAAGLLLAAAGQRMRARR